MYDAGVDAVLDQPRRVGMAQSVRGYPALYACRTDGGGEGARQHAVIELRVTEMAGEQPAAVVVRQPQVASSSRTGCGSGKSRSLSPLPTIRNTWLAPVDGANFQRGGFADAQTTGIHDGEAGLVGRVADTAEQATDLIVR